LRYRKKPLYAKMRGLYSLICKDFLLQELAPCFISWLPGFIGPVPLPLWIRADIKLKGGYEKRPPEEEVVVTSRPLIFRTRFFWI
jgi:hypothetical protein